MSSKIKENIFNILKKSNSNLTGDFILNKFGNMFTKTAIKKAINSLKLEGKLTETRKGKIKLLKNSGKISAIIVSQSKNFSFAKDLNGNAEIFISKNDLKSALIGDHVIISKIKKSEKGTSGVVEKILQTGNHIVSGKLMCNLNGLEVCCDPPVKYNIPVLKGYSMGAKIGDKVKVFLSYKSKNGNLGAKVIKIYGKSDSAKVCTDAIIDSAEIPTIFSDETINQAEKIAYSGISEDEISRRLDLRDESVFTIDGEDSKDLDDAISIKKLAEGWELGVHIADVSHYVKFGTPLDKEAFKRGTSVYLADRVIPMFPKIISNGICSLNEGEDKLTFSSIITMNEEGKIVDYKFVKSIIRSKVRGIYSEVNEIINGNASDILNEKYKNLKKHIINAKKLSDILSKNAQARGVIDISGTESKFSFDEMGKCIDVKTRCQGESERIIENFMITANTAAAKYAKESDSPFVYRIHESPDIKKVEVLAKLSKFLGLKWNNYRFESITPADLSNLIKQAKGTPAEKIVSRQILQTLAKARYDSKPLGHFGLSLKDYCHFTSPIRRYPDIYVHRVLGEILKNDNSTSKNLIKKIEKNAKICSKGASLCEIRAMKTEREVEKYYMAEYMSEHIGETFSGIISGASYKGIFIELENSVSGFMDLSCYEDYRFEFDGIATHCDKSKNKKLSVGDKIIVKLISVNISSALINFAPAESLC